MFFRMNEHARPAPAAAADFDGFLARVGERVRTGRSRRGLSRKALAQHSGVSERYLAQLEAGTGNCSLLLLRRVAEAMRVPMAELIAEQPAHSGDGAQLMQLIDRLSPEQIAAARDYLVSHFGAAIGGRRQDRIALIGLRGGGKSTLGKLLGKALEAPFIELNRPPSAAWNAPHSKTSLPPNAASCWQPAAASSPNPPASTSCSPPA